MVLNKECTSSVIWATRSFAMMPTTTGALGKPCCLNAKPFAKQQKNKDIGMALPKKILKKKYVESFCLIIHREYPSMTEAINMDTVLFFFNAGIEVHEAVDKYMEVEN